MTDLSLIASRLGLRVVDLDEKPSVELVELLIDELRKYDKELVTSGILQFLQLHKCDLLPSTSSDEWDEWITSFENGEKRVLYSLLYWAISNSDHLAQRAYLAPFLLPIEVPEELLSNNDNLYDMQCCYRELQHEFIAIHKTFQSMKEPDGVLMMSELNSESDIAAREKEQLLQCAQRTGTGADSAQFQQLLSLTSTLREAQAREAALKQQKSEQLQLSQSAEDRLQGERRISSILSNNANSIDRCITELKTESKEAILKLETGLIPKRLQLEALVAKAEGDAAKPSLPEDDIAYLEELLFQLDQKRQECNNKDTDGILKKAAALSSRLFALKQDASEKSGMKNAYSRENQRLRDELLEKKDSEMTCGIPNLQEKSKLYEEEKEEMLAAQEHNIELEGKKEHLTKKLQAIEQTLQREEEKGEISGYRKVSKTLDDSFQDTCVLNETKSEILEEMSAIVKSIGEKKQTLEPMIEQLKQDRSVFMQIRDAHNVHKSRYEEVQQQLLDENKSLEERVSKMQKECEERESLINLLTTTEPITASTLKQKLEDELQPSFPATSTNLSQLYEDKMYQLQQLQNELGKEHQDKKGGQDYNSRQEAMFTSLKKLLGMKHRSLSTDFTDKQ